AQALEAIDWRRGPVEPVRGRCDSLVECPYFRLDRFQGTGEFAAPSAGQLSIWLLLDGQAELSAGAGYRRLCRPRDTLLAPAAARDVLWRAAPAVALLRVRLPGIR